LLTLFPYTTLFRSSWRNLTGGTFHDSLSLFASSVCAFSFFEKLSSEGVVRL
jgi:hypothetical protein